MHSSPKHVRIRPRTAFTLIELLTVIAIIGILAAIIIPTVKKVRETAKKAQCVSRLRQWGSVVSLCANDSKGYIPCSFVKKAAPATGYVFDDYITKGKMTTEEAKVASSGVSTLLTPTQAFATCPTGINGDNSINGTIRQYSFIIPFNTKKIPSSVFGGESTTMHAYKHSEAESPAQLLLMIEQNNGQDVINPNSDGQGSIQEALKSPRVRRVQLDAGYVRHGGTAMALFLDGHVAGLSTTDTDWSNSESKVKLERWFTLK